MEQHYEPTFQLENYEHYFSDIELPLTEKEMPHFDFPPEKHLNLSNEQTIQLESFLSSSENIAKTSYRKLIEMLTTDWNVHTDITKPKTGK